MWTRNGTKGTRTFRIIRGTTHKLIMGKKCTSRIQVFRKRLPISDVISYCNQKVETNHNDLFKEAPRMLRVLVWSSMFNVEILQTRREDVSLFPFVFFLCKVFQREIVYRTVFQDTGFFETFWHRSDNGTMS